jgi:hypothetical protein
VHCRLADPGNANGYCTFAAHGDTACAEVDGEGGVFVDAKNCGTVRERSLQLL